VAALGWFISEISVSHECLPCIQCIYYMAHAITFATSAHFSVALGRMSHLRRRLDERMWHVWTVN
jgi:hypothetical protein